VGRGWREKRSERRRKEEEKGNHERIRLDGGRHEHCPLTSGQRPRRRLTDRGIRTAESHQADNAASKEENVSPDFGKSARKQPTTHSIPFDQRVKPRMEARTLK
jgi:hypothetical protein